MICKQFTGISLFLASSGRECTEQFRNDIIAEQSSY